MSEALTPTAGRHLRFSRALEALELSGSETSRELRRAYRRLVAAHPPDRDPDGFRRVRAAYETLQEPEAAIDDLLLREVAVPLPEPATPEALDVDGQLPRQLFSWIVSQVDGRALLGDLDDP